MAIHTIKLADASRVPAQKRTGGLSQPYQVYVPGPNGALHCKDVFQHEMNAQARARGLEADGQTVLIIDLSAIGHGIPYEEK